MTQMQQEPLPDLLQDRRVELGLPRRSPSLRPTGQLLMTGGAVGAVLLLVPILASVFVGFSAKELERTLPQLTPVEQQVAGVRSRLQRASSRTEALNKDTGRITAQLVSIRSGSALFEQLKRSTPAAIQLSSVTVQPAQLNISGTAQSSRRSGPWHQVNAFALKLESLPAVPPEGARVQKVTAKGAFDSAFSLNVQVDPGIRPTPAQLRDLGAEGLARRHALLKDKGLPL